MSETLDSRFLEIFPGYLRTLGEDAAALCDVLRSIPDASGADASGADASGADAGDETRQYVAGALNYIFKSLDLIPDGIDDLGFMDDAFVLRVAAALAVSASNEPPTDGILARLAKDADDVRAFLDADYARLEAYVRSLRKGAARGRTVDDILTQSVARHAFVQEIASWSTGYQTPAFTRDIKTLIKLKAFLNAKLS